MNQDVKAFFQRLQLQPAVLAGHVTSVEIDAQTGQQRYARVAVGSQILRIKVDAFTPPLANGDAVRLEQYGLAASADYRLAGLEAGARPNTGAFAVLNDGTVIGGGTYSGGDYIFGKLDEGNLFIENQTGRLYHRIGLDVYGINYPTGAQLYGHAIKSGGDWVPDGPNVYITPGGVYVRNATTDALRLLSDGSLWAKGDFFAHSLHIGAENGARLFGGTVVDFDAGGNPIVTPTRYGLRLYDASGLPQIALLTGTVDNPHSPALLVGADNAASYLRWLNGILELRGYAIIDGGQLGSYIVTGKRITSTNNRVILCSDKDMDFAEGLLLITGEAADAGTIAWRKSAAAGHEDDYAGILTTYWQPGGPGVNQRAEMLIGVADLFSNLNTTPCAKLRLEASTPTSAYSEKAHLEIESTVVDPYEVGDKLPGLFVRTNCEVQAPGYAGVNGAQFVMHGLPGETWIGTGDFVSSTAHGTAGRLALGGAGIECSASGYIMYWQFRVPGYWAGAQARLKRLRIHYKTTLAAAYITSVKLLTQNLNDGTMRTDLEYGQPLGQGVTGVGYAELLESDMMVDPDGAMVLRVDLAGVSDYGHVVIYGFKAEWESK